MDAVNRCHRRLSEQTSIVTRLVWIDGRPSYPGINNSPFGHIIQCFAKASNHESIQLAFTGTITGGIRYDL